MGEVVDISGTTTLPIPADKILKAGVGNVTNVVVIGLDKDGELYASTSMPDKTEIPYLIEIFKNNLLNKF